jgi:dipeptidyl aminopeptidase/acylaminoacyl peptidase
MIEERHTVPFSGGQLALVLHLPEGGQRRPLVLACHGLGAGKDSEKYLVLGVELPAAGVALARFDFRGCGESTGTEDDTTIGTRLEDARSVLKFLAFHRRLDGRLGLLGSSLGGYTVLHLAAERSDAPPVVTWNAPSNLDDLMETTEPEARGLGGPFFRELNERTYAAAPAGVSCHLVVQGEADEVVSVEHGATLYARAAEPCDMVIIPGADHRLSDSAHRKEAVACSREWFLRFLG